MENLAKLLEYHQLALSQVKDLDKKRFLYSTFSNLKGKHFTGIIGPRGVGKSILLRQLSLEIDDSIYISVDTLPDLPLFEIVKQLSENYKITTFFLDEVHFCKTIDAELKKMYDLLDVKVVFTSSVALGMIQSSYDLSRRVKLIKLSPFSFREYLYFKKGVKIELLNLDSILNQTWTTSHMKFTYLFEDYLKGGIMPFSLQETEIYSLLKNILNTIIQKDLPKISTLQIGELDIIEKLVRYIGKSGIDGVNYSSISDNLKITKYKAEQYVGLLTKSFVLNCIFPKGTNVLKEPKILMNLPYRLLYQSYEEAIGSIREDFAVETLINSGYPVNYLKSTKGKKTPDFLITYNELDLVIEVGGKSKGRTQFKGVKYDKKLIFSHSSEVSDIRRPLSLLGFLY